MKTQLKRAKEPIRSQTIGEKIRGLRLNRAISQQEVAKRAGLSQSAIAQIENGQRDPSIGTLTAIAGALKIPVAKVIAGGSIVVVDLDEIREINSAEDLDSQTYRDLSLISSELSRLHLER